MDDDQILELYDLRRTASHTLNGELFRSVSKASMNEAARRLGILRKGTIVFDNESEMAIFSDACLYEVYVGGENAIARMLRNAPPPEGSFEREVLEAMSRTRYSIFVPTEMRPGVGAKLHDLIGGSDAFVVDRGISTSLPTVLAVRLYGFDEFSMSSGAALPLASEDIAHEALSEVLRRYPDLTPERFANAAPSVRSDIFFAITRILLGRGQSRHVRFVDPTNPDEIAKLESEQPSFGRLAPGPSEPQVRRGPSVGRNDPCPCGSRKKYKKCHGA